MIDLPQPRGAVTERLLHALRAGPGPVGPAGDPDEEDLQLALYLCYELHYRGLPGVDDRWEWEPSLLALRAELERAHAMLAQGGAARQRAVAAERGLHGLVAWLADRFSG